MWEWGCESGSRCGFGCGCECECAHRGAGVGRPLQASAFMQLWPSGRTKHATVTNSREPRRVGAPHSSGLTARVCWGDTLGGWTARCLAQSILGRAQLVSLGEKGCPIAARDKLAGTATKGESLHCARTAHALRATFRLCSPRRAPKQTPWKHP